MIGAAAPPAVLESAADVFERARTAGRDRLNELQVYAILSALGFDVPRHAFWPLGSGAALPADVRDLLSSGGDEFVVKAVSADLLHKSEAGGLRVVRGRAEDVEVAAQSVLRSVGRNEPGAVLDGVLVVEKLAVDRTTPASETILAVRQDPAFGPYLLFGLGGLLTEWFGQLSGGGSTVILAPGRVREGLARAIETLPAFRLLFASSRSAARPPLDLDPTVARLEALAALAVRLSPRDPETGGTVLEELEVNPLIRTPDGRWVAADGKAALSARTVAGSRRPLGKIATLLAPRSAAVFGASAASLNPGRLILRNLKASEGLRYGHLWAVHPKETEIDGIACVPSAEALPEKVDLAVVSVPAEAAPAIVAGLVRADRAEAVILIPGGFAETGRHDLENAVKETLAVSRSTPGGGPVLLGGNCLGVVSKHRYNTFFLPQYKLPFHDAPGDDLVAVSQSGAYLVSLTSNLDGVIFPRASISFGNQIDLTSADLLEFLETDPTVRVVALYVEGFMPLDGQRVAGVVRRMRAAGRRVVVFKAGKTPLGAKAAASHTASLAGDYAVARSLLQDAGAVVAETLNMFEDYVKVFTMLGRRLPAGRRLAVLSNAGFECSAVLDRLFGLEPAELSPESRGRLSACLPPIAHADNPVDATPMAATNAFVEAAEVLLADPGVDALLVSPVPVTPALDDLSPDPHGAHRENVFGLSSLPQELLRVFQSTAKPMAMNVDSGRLYDDMVTVLQRGGVPVFRKIDRASRALSALCTL